MHTIITNETRDNKPFVILKTQLGNAIKVAGELEAQLNRKPTITTSRSVAPEIVSFVGSVVSSHALEYRLANQLGN